jgi:hypothetical protein
VLIDTIYTIRRAGSVLTTVNRVSYTLLLSLLEALVLVMRITASTSMGYASIVTR